MDEKPARPRIFSFGLALQFIITLVASSAFATLVNFTLTKQLAEKQYNLDALKTFKDDLLSEKKERRGGALLLLATMEQNKMLKLNISCIFMKYDSDKYVSNIASRICNNATEDLKVVIAEEKGSKRPPSAETRSQPPITEEDMNQLNITSALSSKDLRFDRCYATIESDNSLESALETIRKIRIKIVEGRKFSGKMYIYLAPNGMFALTTGKIHKSPMEATAALAGIILFLEPGTKPLPFCGVDWGEPVFVSDAETSAK